MVRALHAAGIEVDPRRGLQPHGGGGRAAARRCRCAASTTAATTGCSRDARRYADYTGCGNTLHVVQPHVLRLITDSLRYWVTEMGVDGFRFDLAAALARSMHDVDMLSPFLAVIAQDPVLRRVKLIAEPWDVGIGRLPGGRLPAAVDGVERPLPRRRTGLLARRAARRTGPRLPAVRVQRPVRLGRPAAVRLGQLHHRARRFHPARPGRRTSASTTRPTARATGTAPNDNRSWNCGAEGETDDPRVSALRRRQLRNLLTTLLLSTGVPMLVAGDEMGRTQGGNNNAYCQDNEISWLDWSLLEDPGWRPLLELTARLIALRHAHPGAAPPRLLLRPRPARRTGCGTWPGSRARGTEMTERDWYAPDRRPSACTCPAATSRAATRGARRSPTTASWRVLHAGDRPVSFVLPGPPWAQRYELVVDTSREDQADGAGHGAPGGGGGDGAGAVGAAAAGDRLRTPRPRRPARPVPRGCRPFDPAGWERRVWTTCAACVENPGGARGNTSAIALERTSADRATYRYDPSGLLERPLRPRRS